MSNPEIQDAFKIGENDYGYEFGVCRMGNEWHGFAVGTDDKDGSQMIFFLPEAEDTEKSERLIKLVGAIAENPENGYGGITRWNVPEFLRGRMAEFICPTCGSFNCPPDEHWDEQETAGENINLGACCICEIENDSVRNILCLDKKAVVAGHGWGCLVCSLANDGAVAVVCDDCFERMNSGEVKLKFAARGYPATDGRIAIEDLTENFAHDLTKHPEEEQWLAEL